MNNPLVDNSVQFLKLFFRKMVARLRGFRFPVLSSRTRTRRPTRAFSPGTLRALRISRWGEALQSRLCSSVANLDARSIPNAPIPIPHGGASGPVACRRYVHGSGRYVDGGWLIVAGTARYRCSKQCTNCQAANNPGGDVTTPCSRNPGCTRQTKTACD
jgi:hypothetical protein